MKTSRITPQTGTLGVGLARNQHIRLVDFQISPQVLMEPPVDVETLSSLAEEGL